MTFKPSCQARYARESVSLCSATGSPRIHRAQSRTRELSLLLAVCLMGLTGCEALRELGRKKVDNPVMGPPPPRQMVRQEDEQNYLVNNAPTTTGPRVENEKVVLVSLENTALDGTQEIPDNHVVATVNGSPIFAGEILERHTPMLRQAKEKAPPAEYQKLRLELVKRDLPGHVDRHILVYAIRSQLKKEQVEGMREQLKLMFDEETVRMQKQFKVNSRPELDELLQSQGTSLASLQDAFEMQKMAIEYLRSKSKTPQLGRTELYEYYQEHLEDYSVPSRVRWQQILISFDKHGGKSGAFTILNNVVQELKEGHDFGEVASRLSDGPTANRGGQWDWMEAGSLANKQIERALFELPAGMISQVFTTNADFQIVRIQERTAAYHKPFGEVQEEIKEKLEEELHKQSTQMVLRELRATARVESIFGANLKLE